MKRFVVVLFLVLGLSAPALPSRAQSPAIVAREIAALVKGSAAVDQAVLKALMADQSVASFFRTATKQDLMLVTMQLGGNSEVGFKLGGQAVLALSRETQNPFFADLAKMCGEAGAGCPLGKVGTAIDEAAVAAAEAAPPAWGAIPQPIQMVRTTLGAGVGRPKVYRSSLSTNYNYLQSATLDQKGYPAMNLRRLQPNEWLLIDEQFAEQLEMKRRLFELRKDKVFYVAPKYTSEAREAGRELLDEMAEYLPRNYPDIYKRDGNFLENLVTGERANVVNGREHPLSIAGRLVQEDLTIVHTGADGQHRLIAGAVYFPSNWTLQNFAGLTVADIHSGIPGFKDKLERGVNNLLTRLDSDRMIGRNNWFVYQDPTLPQPGDRYTGYDVANPTRGSQVGEQLYLRSERETLRRLPKSKAIIFTIREHVYPMSTLEQFPEVAGRLATGIRNVKKDLPEPFEKPVLQFLDGITKKAETAAAKTPPPATH